MRQITVGLTFVLATIIFLFIFGCATKHAKYSKRLHAYEGRHINEIIEQWGAPVKSYAAPNGNKVYVFYMVDLKTSKDINASVLGNYPGSESHISRVDVCTTYFETNADGKIVRCYYEGTGCKQR